MYSVNVTPGRSSEKSSKTVDTEMGMYRSRRKESIPVKVFNYLKTQMQAEGIPTFMSEHSPRTMFTQKIQELAAWKTRLDKDLEG